MKPKLSFLVPAILVAAILYPQPVPRDAAAGEPAPTPKDAARGKLQYNRDIRPILAENCFACHGPDSAARKKDLRIDQFDAAVEAGAIVPGKPEKSEMVRRIFADERDGMMPPAKSHKKLTTAQKELLKRWIAEGAEYQQHWSFIAPVRPKVPDVRDKAWVRNPIDAFILAKLEAAGLKPAPEA
ncbi:MAG TPA: c-type cytochrome domain-containing protein, partial [Gemmata sp.]|nr:c-type cytochrome domain-containing protein [Gemmata sp.]